MQQGSTCSDFWKWIWRILSKTKARSSIYSQTVSFWAFKHSRNTILDTCLSIIQSIKLEPPENFKNEGPMVLNLPPLPTSQPEQKKTSIPISISNRLNIPTTSSAASLTVIKAPQQVQPKVLSKKCEYDGPYCKEFQTPADLESHKLLWHGNYIPTICERCFQRSAS